MTWICPITHFYANVRNEYLHDGDQNEVGKITPCVVYGVSSTPGRALGFSVLLETGASYWDIPVNALCSKPTPPLPLEDLQLWDCFGDRITSCVFEYLDGLRSTAKIGDATMSARYVMTFDWIGNGFSREPSQDKCAHLLALDDGNFALLPNNRIRFTDKSFTEDVPLPKYKTNTRVYRCE